MKTTFLFSIAMWLPAVFSLKRNCQCPCACRPDGAKLKDLINCFATWQENVATDANSHTDNCKESEIVHCRTATEEDKFCKFDGTNNLVEVSGHPKCYYNCGMQTCNAFLIAHSLDEMECIAKVFREDDDE